MILRQILSALRAASFAFLIAFIFNSCTDNVCTYPAEQFGRVRLVNAMIDVPKISVFIGGKLFRADYTYDPPQDFGYFTTYADGTPLTIGDSLFIVVTSDAAGRDTIITSFMTINLHRQTLIVAGKRFNDLPTDLDTRRIIRLDDEEAAADQNATLVRFVNCVPDLPTLDVYMKKSAVGDKFIQIAYGEKTSHLTLPVADENDGLTVTEAARPLNVVISLPYPFKIKGFFATIIIRGASKPVGLQPLPGPFVLSDMPIGNYILDFATSGIRFVNGMRDQTLSLLASNPNENIPRDNIPGQEAVLNIPSDSISKFFGLGVSALGNTRWYFSRQGSSDTIHSFPFITKKNERWTIVAVDGPAVSHLTLRDSMTKPAGDFVQVRVVHISPDHQNISFTLGGRSVTMQKFGVEYFTVPVGSNSINFTDGAQSGQFSFTAALGSHPITLFILPDKPSKRFPVAMTDE